jgi:hypothetical protein
LTVLKHAKAAVHEIISDEARHGKGFEDLLKRYFGNKLHHESGHVSV